jgi:hypothetical protein
MWEATWGPVSSEVGRAVVSAWCARRGGSTTRGGVRVREVRGACRAEVGVRVNAARIFFSLFLEQTRFKPGPRGWQLAGPCARVRVPVRVRVRVSRVTGTGRLLFRSIWSVHRGSVGMRTGVSWLHGWIFRSVRSYSQT